MTKQDWINELNEKYEEIEAMEEANAMGDGNYDDQDFEEAQSEIEYIRRQIRNCK